MMMYNPAHPGKVINELCLKPLNLSITEAAKGLGVSRNTLSEIINGRANISTMMAVRLSMAFGGSPDSWLSNQMHYDLWMTQKSAKKLRIKSFLKAS